MKLKEAMKIIEEGWVKRRKGYRIRFERRNASEWVMDCFPAEGQKPLTSEISAWELARRFAEATIPGTPHSDRVKAVNVHVVDDEGNPVQFYGARGPKIFNPKEASAEP